MKRITQLNLSLAVIASLALPGTPVSAQSRPSFLFPWQTPAAAPAEAHPPQPRQAPRTPTPAPAPVAPAPAPAPNASTAPEPNVPYEQSLLRLSEVMGSLTYLRDLCGQKDGNDWRAKMANLIEAEGVTDRRRERLAGAYNRGYHDYETTYRVCTDNARTIISRYIDEGSRLAHDITNRFGGG